MTALAKAATVYAAAGWPVFPCEIGGKAPLGRLVPHGFKDATCDPEIIRRWWTSEPEANIGTPTGVLFDVLDVDLKPAGNGWAALELIRAAGHLGGAAAAANTRNGGIHVYYPASGGRSRAYPKHFIDVKAAGGYVLVPPSLVPADDGIPGPGRYEWTTFPTATPDPLDVSAVDLLLNPPRLQRPCPKRTPGRRKDDGDALVKWLERQSEGNRNAGLFWAAKKATVLGLLDDDLRGRLAAAALALGVTEREAHATIKSGVTHGTKGGAA